MRLIDRESTISELRCLPEQDRLEYMGIYDVIRSMPTIEAEPVKHGVEIESEFSQEKFLKYQIWRFMPVINVDYVKDIPADYPGLMGVPITFEGKRCRDQFELVDCVRPVIDGKEKYNRLIILNKKPRNGGIYTVRVSYEYVEESEG